LLSQAGFTIISPSNTAPDLTEPGNANNYPGYLRTAHNDTVQGAVAAQYAYNVEKVTKAATIHDGSLYADKLQEVFATNFEQLGGTITAQTAVDPNQTDMARCSDIAPEVPVHLLPHLPACGPLIMQQACTDLAEEMGADGLPGRPEEQGDFVEKSVFRARS
jgi:hypothetical protein